MSRQQCPRCGSPRSGASRYCSNCAYDFWGAAAGYSQAPAPPEQAPATAPGVREQPAARDAPARAGSRRIGPLLAGGGILVAAIWAGSMLGGSGQPSGIASASGQPTEESTASATRQPTAAPTQAPALGEAPQAETVAARVTRIVDGDTIHVQVDGADYALRYIGIDAPETGTPHADEATALNEQLVGGQVVYLERDVSETDQFGRLLRYVWLQRAGSWLLVNRELVLQGVAESKAYPPDTAYQGLFDAAQVTALAGAVGIWGGAASPLASAEATGNCDPSYPTVCIPPYPPDLDCGDIPYRRFEVLSPDPHGFDADHDGIGCESG